MYISYSVLLFSPGGGDAKQFKDGYMPYGKLVFLSCMMSRVVTKMNQSLVLCLTSFQDPNGPMLSWLQHKGTVQKGYNTLGYLCILQLSGPGPRKVVKWGG